MDAFDADVLIYAAVADHPLGRRIRALFARESESHAGLGSVLLPEILAKPMRDGHAEELTALAGLLSRLELRVIDAVIAEVATSLAATHRLPAADAVHLATALVAGADRFLTTNRRDSPTLSPTSTSPTRARCQTPQQADSTGKWFALADGSAPAGLP